MSKRKIHTTANPFQPNHMITKGLVEPKPYFEVTQQRKIQKKKCVDQIVVTTDFHSSFEFRDFLFGNLINLRKRSIIIDAGDFFEGNGYYRLSQGELEIQALVQFFDWVVPGNHGYRHYVEEKKLKLMTICANISKSPSTQFRPFLLQKIRGCTVGIVGIIGDDAFKCIPRQDLSGESALEPVNVLNELFCEYKNIVDKWVVVSHSGWEHDLQLIAECPWLSLVFSGHCHSKNIGPIVVGNTYLVKAPELGEGFAVARLSSSWKWRVHVHTCNDSSSYLFANSIGRIKLYDTKIKIYDAHLSASLGLVRNEWRGKVDTRRLLVRIAACVLINSSVELVLINLTCFRTTTLCERLTLNEAFRISPFHTELVCVSIRRDMLSGLLATLKKFLGEIVVESGGLKSRDSEFMFSAVTTKYIADNYLPCIQYVRANINVVDLLVGIVVGEEL